MKEVNIQQYKESKFMSAHKLPVVLSEHAQQGNTRLLLDALYDAAHARAMKQMPPPEADDEEAIMLQAVQLTLFKKHSQKPTA